jgi:hypothetical protein
MSTTPDASTGPLRTRRPGDRILVAGAVVLALAVVAGVVLAVAGTPRYAEGTPERVAQRYLEALLDDQHRRAREHLAPELASRCEPGEPRAWYPWASGSIRFQDVRIADGRAEIDLELSDVEPIDPFELPLDERRLRVRHAELTLEQRSGEWLITEAGPPINGCERR